MNSRCYTEASCQPGPSRLEKTRAYLVQEKAAALYLRDVASIEWLTGFQGVFDTEAAHALYIDANKAVLHTDSRYAAVCEQAASLALDSHGAQCFTIDTQRMPHGKFASDLYIDGLKDNIEGAVIFEDSISLAEFTALEKHFAENSKCLLPKPQPVATLRSQKDSFEIQKLKAAQEITDAAFKHICTFIKEGMTEKQVQLELDFYMYSHGADSLAFPSIVATGANGANPHAIPGDTKIKKGECVVLDFGARKCGYCADMTRIVFMGEPSKEMRAAYATLRAANEQVSTMLKAGVTGAQAHELAEEILKQHGFEGKMGHSLGHGVGVEVHEFPNLSPFNKAPLKEGNVVTVEPGIYISGEFGMRLEDYGVVTNEAFEVFSRSTHEMMIL